MTLNSWPSCLYLPSGGIVGIPVILHLAQVKKKAISLRRSLTMQPSLGLNSRSSCLSLSNYPKNHHTWHKMVPQKTVKSSLIRYHWLFHVAVLLHSLLWVLCSAAGTGTVVSFPPGPFGTHAWLCFLNLEWDGLCFISFHLYVSRFCCQMDTYQ